MEQVFLDEAGLQNDLPKPKDNKAMMVHSQADCQKTKHHFEIDLLFQQHQQSLQTFFTLKQHKQSSKRVNLALVIQGFLVTPVATLIRDCS